MVQHVVFKTLTNLGMQNISLVGEVKCKHSDGSFCVKLDSTEYGLNQSRHYDDKYVYHVNNQTEVYPYTNNIKENIRTRLKNLVFKQVHTIVLKLKDLAYTRRYYYDRQPEKVGMGNIGQNVKSSYNDYVGFTMREYDGTETKNHSTPHLSIFTKSNMAELSFISPTIGEWLKSDDLKSSIPPNKGDMICGTIFNNNNIYHYNRWFSCSPQFYRLCILIVHGTTHETFSGKNKNQILDSLETNKSKKTIGSPSTKAANYKHNNYEKSFEYPDIYKAIAQLFYFQDGPPSDLKIPPMYWLPSPPEIYKFSLLAALGKNVRI